MPRKTNLDRPAGGRRRGGRGQGTGFGETRMPRPKPKIDFTVDALDYRNSNLLRQFVTDAGRVLPRKYTGLPAHYQRRLTRAIKQARQMLLMK
jgi:small subunit ribosomal protein S18